MEALAVAYLWIVAAHVIFVIFWMAGLFMLPRYLVYHQEALAAGRSDEAALWVEREGKIRSIILTPAVFPSAVAQIECGRPRSSFAPECPQPTRSVPEIVCLMRC